MVTDAEPEQPPSPVALDYAREAREALWRTPLAFALAIPTSLLSLLVSVPLSRTRGRMIEGLSTLLQQLGHEVIGETTADD